MFVIFTYSIYSMNRTTVCIYVYIYTLNIYICIYVLIDIYSWFTHEEWWFSISGEDFVPPLQQQWARSLGEIQLAAVFGEILSPLEHAGEIWWDSLVGVGLDGATWGSRDLGCALWESYDGKYDGNIWWMGNMMENIVMGNSIMFPLGPLS